MTNIAEAKGGEGKSISTKKKDKVAIASFVTGLVSIPFAFIGAVPIVAIGLGVWGITRTKEVGTGRWMAVVGLSLGVVYLISNAYLNGHFASNSSQNRAQLSIMNTPAVTLSSGSDSSISKQDVLNDEATVEVSKIPVNPPEKQTPKIWSTLTQFSGVGITNTQTFRITGDEIRITGTLQPSHQYSAYASFRLMCNNCGKYYLGHELSINTYGGITEKDSIVYRELPAGEYYVDINSMAPDAWSITIEEYR